MQTTVDTPDEPVVVTVDEPVVVTADESVVDTADEPVVDTADEPVVDTADEPVVDTADEPVKPCPGRVRVSEGYTWYVRVTDDDPTLFTMCAHCYNNLSDEQKSLYKLYDDQSELSNVNCDSQFSIDNSTTLYKDDMFRVTVSTITDDGGEECQYSDVDGKKCFDVPTGSQFDVCVETCDPTEYISYSSATFDNVAYVTSGGAIPVLYRGVAHVHPPTSSWTLSEREKLENPSAFAKKTGVFKIILQRWRRRSYAEMNDDVIPLPQYEKIGDTVELSFLLKSSQSDEELYRCNTEGFRNEHEQELVSWFEELEYTQKHLTAISNALAKGRAEFAESVEKFVSKYGRQPVLSGSTQGYSSGQTESETTNEVTSETTNEVTSETTNEVTSETTNEVTSETTNKVNV